jgi:hypothetical protein
MNFDEYKNEYLSLFKEMMKYSPKEYGATLFAEKMAVMYELNPDWAEKIESEIN